MTMSSIEDCKAVIENLDGSVGNSFSSSSSSSYICCKHAVNLENDKII